MPDSHPYRVTNTKCRIYTVISPDDGHIVAQKTYRVINKYTKSKLCTKLALLVDPPKDYLSTKIRGILCEKMNLDTPFFILIDDN